MTASSDIYALLQQKLDALGFGFPASAPDENGERLDVTVLTKFFSTEDAEVFVALRTYYQTPEEFAAYSGYDAEFAAKKLYDMSKRGLLYRRGTERGLEYRLIPLVHGVFEFNVDDPDMLGWFAPFGEYLGKSMFMPAVTGTDTPFERALPVSADLVSDGILPQDDIVSIVKDMDDSFAVADCICRKPGTLLGAPQKHPLRTCMYTGEWAKYAVENGFAEPTTRENILKLIRDSEPGGRVVQVLNSEKPEVICSCDSEACLVLVQHKLGLPGPARALRSNYLTTYDRDSCSDCGVCVERCPVNAFTFGEDGTTVEHNAEMCCGCGLCVSTCPEESIALVKKDLTYQPVGGAFDSYDRQAAYRHADPNLLAR